MSWVYSSNKSKLGVEINLRKNIGILAGVLVLGMSIPTLAASTATGDGITVCVDWTTKEVKYSKYWEKCPSKTTAIELGTVGTVGPQGETGPAGAVGPAGPAGASGSSGSSGSSFRLDNYPTLEWLEGAIAETDCDTRWGAIISFMATGGGNIISDEFGQPVRNDDFALELAGNCPYIYPEIFENPKVTALRNLVHSDLSRATHDFYSGATADYQDRVWIADVTAFDLDVSLDEGWHLCTTADPQYAAFDMSQETIWSQLDADTIQFAGSAALRFYSANPTPGSKGYLDGAISPQFCGPTERTASGLGTRHLSIESVISKVFSDFSQTLD